MYLYSLMEILNNVIIVSMNDIEFMVNHQTYFSIFLS